MNNTMTKKKASAKNDNKKFIASVTALVAAAAMATGLLIFTFSGDPIKKTDVTQTPVAAAETIAYKDGKAPREDKTAAASDPVVKAEKKEAAAPVDTAKPAAILKQEAPAVKAQPVVEEKKQEAPAVQAQPVVEEKKEEAPAVMAQPVVEEKKQEAPAVQAQPVVEEKKEDVPAVPAAQAPQLHSNAFCKDMVNDWRVHDAKDGFPIGCYTDKDSNSGFLNVEKINCSLYKISVTYPTGANTATVYTFTAYANGSKMYYDKAVKSAVVFDENGDVAECDTIDTEHKGTFDASDAGYTWIDTEGTTIFIPWIGYR